VYRDSHAQSGGCIACSRGQGGLQCGEDVYPDSHAQSGGCIACSRGQGGLQCGEDEYLDNHAQRTIEFLQLPFFLAGVVFWLLFASTVYGIVHVCIHFGTPVLNIVQWNGRMFL